MDTMTSADYAVLVLALLLAGVALIAAYSMGSWTLGVLRARARTRDRRQACRTLDESLRRQIRADLERHLRVAEVSSSELVTTATATATTGPEHLP